MHASPSAAGWLLHLDQGKGFHILLPLLLCVPHMHCVNVNVNN